MKTKNLVSPYGRDGQHIRLVKQATACPFVPIGGAKHQPRNFDLWTEEYKNTEMNKPL